MQLPLLHYTCISTRYTVTLYSNLPPLTILKECLSSVHVKLHFSFLECTAHVCVQYSQLVMSLPHLFQIKRVRKATREEKKRRAMAMRQKELGALGMEVNEKGQVIAQSTLVSEMEGQLIEESGLKCCICLEGYKNQPQKVC